MKTFYIHFSRNRKGAIFSKILQKYEGLPISHILVEFDISSLKHDFVYHSAIGAGVSFMEKGRFESINEIMETYEITITDEQFEEMVNNLTKNCGEHYAVAQNLGVALVDLARRLFGLDMENPWKDGQNCSELMYRNVVPYLCDHLEDYKPDLIRPSQIRTILKEHGILPIFSKI